MSGFLRGAVAVITGAGSGIGKGVAQMMANQGAKIAVCDLSLNAAQQTQREIVDAKGQAFAVEMDVTNEKQVQDAFNQITSHFGTQRVDVLIANAGFQHIAPVDEFAFADWKKMAIFLFFFSFQQIFLIFWYF